MGGSPQSPPKKRNRLSVYLTKWEKEEKYYSWLLSVKNNSFKAWCNTCNCEFFVAFGGESDLKQHASTALQKRSVQSSSKQKITIFVKKNSSKEQTVIVSEITICYNNVKHNLSYNSFDCNVKLFRHMFGDDSSRISKLACGRSKAEALVKNVLGPKSASDFLVLLKSPEGTAKSFAFATDASNKGNRKFFPVCLRYVDPVVGVQWKVLDIVEQSDESSAGIYELLKCSIKRSGLSLDKMSSYSADNANVNYGIKRSVYKHLQTENKFVLKANCNAHILHTCYKHASNLLDIDVETVVLKFFRHF